jgi:predicted AAA+ superfamily ATPase
MLTRRHLPLLRRLLREFPVVTILGPRQCGKTTFARQALGGWTYLDLERPRDATPLAADPEARLEQLGEHVILDEAQQVPNLFPVLRGVVDRRRSGRGRFVLLGSASPDLIGSISESLAGRTGFLDLTALRWSEVATRRGAKLETLWFRGGFPEAFLARSEATRTDWLESYVRTYIERDLRRLGIEFAAATMRKLWAMLAHINGGLWNASQIASSLGVTYHTINRYVDILERTFLIRRLEPFHANLGKRLVKSPKVYFRDTGLLHFFHGVAKPRDLDVHPARGASWEGFVIEEVTSALRMTMPAAEVFFWRTATGEEVDLLLRIGSRLVPIEIKLNSSPTAEHAKDVRRCMLDLGCKRGYVVYPGDGDYSLGGGVMALSASRLLKDPRNVAKL